MAIPTCTVSGSFRRHLGPITSKIAELQRAGFTVLSPRTTESVGEIDGFVILQGDSGDPRQIEEGHLSAIRRSDCLYIVNPTGYIGPSATMEIGYAIALGIPVFAQGAPIESILSMFIRTEPNVEFVKQSVLRAFDPGIPKRADLATLQAYVQKVVAARGFDKETLRDVLLLLMEEVGELAKAVRKQTGLKTAANDPNANKVVAHELADCLIYLLDIANLANVDLDLAFREKELINSRKVWETYPSDD